MTYQNVKFFWSIFSLVYAEFGTGTLQILDHGDVALNELRLVDGDKRELLHQYIYKWNSSLKRLDESTKTCLCLWDGAVCFSLEADAVPERRDFKVRLSSEGEADDFVDTFNKVNPTFFTKKVCCVYYINYAFLCPERGEST